MVWRWLNPWGPERRSLVTRLSVAECGFRLESRLAPWDLTAPDASRPLQGELTRDGFRLAPPGRGAWQIEAWGTLQPQESGTLVVVALGQSRPTTVVETLVVVAVALYLLAAAALAPTGPDWRNGVAALVVGVALHALGHSGSDEEAARLLRFLRATLDAEEAGG